MIEIKTDRGATKIVMDGDVPSLLADCVMIVKELAKHIDELDVGYSSKRIIDFILEEAGVNDD